MCERQARVAVQIKRRCLVGCRPLMGRRRQSGAGANPVGGASMWPLWSESPERTEQTLSGAVGQSGGVFAGFRMRHLSGEPVGLNPRRFTLNWVDTLGRYFAHIVC